MALQSPTNTSVRMLHRQQEEDFLQELYQSLQMFAKPLLHNWFVTPGQDYCSFTGITCTVEDHLVTIIHMTNMGFSGTLPLDFSPLTQLVQLTLYNNDIDGLLPNQFPATLLHFNVAHNRLHGPVLFLDNHGAVLSPVLKRLILSDNFLNGAIPTSICQHLRLRALNLSNNPTLFGTLPECLGELDDLTSLQIENTGLEWWTSSYTMASDEPSQSASGTPTARPFTSTPSTSPSDPPSRSANSSWIPSLAPSVTPSESMIPSDAPSLVPSDAPSWAPSMIPSELPSQSAVPSPFPSSMMSSASPSESTEPSNIPSFSASNTPSQWLSTGPSLRQSLEPSSPPSAVPTLQPTESFFLPTNRLTTWVPSGMPSLVPPLDPAGIHSIAGSFPDQGNPSTNKRDHFTTYFPVMVLFCCMGLVGFLSAVIRVAKHKRYRFFRDLSSTSSSLEISETSGEDTPTPPSALKPEGGATFVPQETTVIHRPCIVRPGTLAANPKVRFLLLAKFSSGDEDDDDDLEHVQYSCSGESYTTEESYIKQPETSAPTSPAIDSIFRQPSAIMNLVSDDEWADSKPASLFLSRSASPHSFEHYSVSSTTPMLNPIEQLQCEDGGSPKRVERPRIQAIDGEQWRDSMKIVTHTSTSSSGSSPCHILRELSAQKRLSYAPSPPVRVMMDDRDDVPSTPDPSTTYSDGVVLVDWPANSLPVLGIRSKWAANREEDDAIEIVEINQARGGMPRWLEVTEIDI